MILSWGVIDNKDCHEDIQNGYCCAHDKGPAKACDEGDGIYVFRAFQDAGRGGGTDVKEGKAKRYPELRCRIE